MGTKQTLQVYVEVSVNLYNKMSEKIGGLLIKRCHNCSDWCFQKPEDPKKARCFTCKRKLGMEVKV